jgi:excisionase family DNA binding protein
VFSGVLRWAPGFFFYAPVFTNSQEVGCVRKLIVTKPDRDLMTCQEAADYVGVSYMTIRRWREQGLPVMQRGSVIRILKNDLLAFLRGV